MVILARWKEMGFLAFCQLQVFWEQNTFTKADLENTKDEALGSPQSLGSEAVEGRMLVYSPPETLQKWHTLAVGWLWGCPWELHCKASKLLISMIRCPGIHLGSRPPQKNTAVSLCRSFSFPGSCHLPAYSQTVWNSECLSNFAVCN